MIATALLLSLLTAAAQADPAPPTPPTPNVAAPPTQDPTASSPTERRPVPTTATAALDQAAAAYEYGDMNLVVESARLVVDGGVIASDADRADALRFLGIGLYLTGRVEGARVAFTELLALRPDARLDTTTTRPEVVAFFTEQKRIHQRRAREQRLARQPNIAWNLLPPFGQFNNGDRVRGYVLLGAGIVFLSGAIVTDSIAESWRNSDNTYGSHTDAARTLKTLNYVSIGLAVATYVAGVIDGFVRHGRADDDDGLDVSFAILPGGGALRIGF